MNFLEIIGLVALFCVGCKIGFVVTGILYKTTRDTISIVRFMAKNGLRPNYSKLWWVPICAYEARYNLKLQVRAWWSGIETRCLSISFIKEDDK